jgi:hypothetical protein
MRFIYHGDRDIGVTAPVLDLHGRALVPPRTVPADHPDAFRKFESGKPFNIDEKLEPALVQFLRIDKNFQNL